MKWQNNKKEKFKLFYSLNLATHLGFAIAIPMVVFIAIGSFLDNCFNTNPIFVLAGLFLALAVSIYEIHHSILPILEKDKDENKNKDKNKDS